MRKLSAFGRALMGGVGTAILLPMSASAVQQGTVTLQFKPKLGAVAKYQTTMQIVMTVPIPKQPRPMTIPMNSIVIEEQRITKVYPQGGGEITSTTISQQTTVNGQPAPAQNSAPVVTAFDRYGRLIRAQGAAPSNPVGGIMGGLNTTGASGLGMYLPTKPVKPGDTWTEPMRVPGISGKGTAKCRLVRLEKVGAFRTARIHADLNLPLRILLDKQQKPTQDPAKAVIVSKGVSAGSFDLNFAMDESRIVRTGGNATTKMTITQKGAQPAAQGGKANPLQGINQMTIKMNMSVEMLR